MGPRVDNGRRTRMRATVPVLWDFLLSSQTRPNSLSPGVPQDGPAPHQLLAVAAWRDPPPAPRRRFGAVVGFLLAVVDHRPAPHWLNDEAGTAVAGLWDSGGAFIPATVAGGCPITPGLCAIFGSTQNGIGVSPRPMRPLLRHCDSVRAREDCVRFDQADPTPSDSGVTGV